MTGFHRLFGDSDGDGDTDQTDFGRFLASLRGGAAGYLWYFDYDADGDVDGSDMAQFNQRRH